MFKEKTIVFFYTEWPVHAGSGSSVGVVDLPIQREVFTELPIFQPSGLKGALREYFEVNFPSRENEIKIRQVFGPPKGADHAGAISLSQARVILFPVASAKGVFAYTTCPLCLQLLRRDLGAIGHPTPSELADIPLTTEEPSPRGLEEGITLVPKANPANNLPGSDQVINNKVILGEFAFEVSPHSKVSLITKWLSEHAIPQSKEYKPWQEKVKESLIILDNDTFRNLTGARTEMVTRNVIGEKGTSENVWTEEYLPTDTLLYSILGAHDPLDGGSELLRLKNAKEVINYLKAPNGVPTSHFFFGGDQTVGRGLLKVQFLD
jgi:CRISPR-associated protein Cmr4